MHIGFRTSRGRGEYELVGSHAGQSAAALEGWEFHFRWPDGVVRDTQLWLDPGDSGKPRLRSLAAQPFQVGRLVAAMLLLPPPRRDKRGVASTLPVLQAKLYVVARIGFGPETEFASPPDFVTAELNYIEAENSVASEFINVSSRWERIARIIGDTAPFSPGVALALDQYRDFLLSRRPVTAELTRIVDSIRRSLEISDPQYGSEFDPLPALERIAGVSAPDQPSLPPPDQLAEDEAEIKARSARLYREARLRESSAQRFAAEVRAAYGNTCAFCGARLGGVPGVPSGIDAAHILAWSSYDLDVISNGIALCKNHHWAFDAALMAPIFQNGVYIVRYTRLAELLDPSALAVLGPDVFPIPEERLPPAADRRPNPRYLRRLYADLAIEF